MSSPLVRVGMCRRLWGAGGFRCSTAGIGRGNGRVERGNERAQRTACDCVFGLAREVPGRGICAVAFSSSNSSATPCGSREEGHSVKWCRPFFLHGGQGRKRRLRLARTSSSISVSSIQFFSVNALALRYHTACTAQRRGEGRRRRHSSAPAPNVKHLLSSRPRGKASTRGERREGWEEPGRTGSSRGPWCRWLYIRRTSAAAACCSPATRDLTPHPSPVAQP